MTTTNARCRRGLAAALLVLAGLAAQAFPDKPVTLLVPFPPGGSTDTLARAVAVKLQEKFGVGEIRKFEGADPMLLDLKAGRIDAAIWWGFTFDYAVKTNPSYELKVVEYMPPEYLGSDKLPGTFYVFRKEGSAALIKAFDAEIANALKTGEGKKIMEKYGLANPAYLTGNM